MENHSGARKVLVPSQPTYLAWPGYFARLIQADQLVLMDDVQFVKHGWQNRNHIWDSVDGRRMLTIPVRMKGRFGQLIEDVEIAASGWERKHLSQITHAYPKLGQRGEAGEQVLQYYGHTFSHLREANEAFIDMVIRLLRLEVKVIRSSSLNVTGQKTDRLLDLCAKTGCNVMRVGPGALEYLDLPLIENSGVELEIVRTASGESDADTEVDLSRLSIVDTLLRHGSNSRTMLERKYWFDKVLAPPMLERAI
ncbi:UNVERIFIED_CONTAM: WbqC family protein [Kocuria sp. CPCC 205316]|uniref:WbqC family protein n=1 Tax=Kocuria TaxID=57493 RepID=UPI0036D7F6E6